jgi:hypothetical protein
MQRGSPAVLGIDIGGVIIDRVNDDTDTSFFGDNYLKTTAVPGAFEAIKSLVDRRFQGHAYVVSKCGKNVERKTREWLAHHDFYRRTGLHEDDVHFCRKRHEKAPICARLGITHFVDDRLEVLSYLETVPHKYLFRPDEAEVTRFSGYLNRVIRVQSWDETVNHALRDD